MSKAKGTIVLTGANGGLGSAIASAIASNGSLSKDHQGLYLVRNAETATTLNNALSGAGATDHKHHVLSLDLGKLASVRQTANEINNLVSSGQIPRIHALILNAGYQDQTTQHFSSDGFALSFQVNYLSQWLLALMLLRSMDENRGRIVIVGSWMHDPYDKRNVLNMYTQETWRTLFHDTESLAKGTWSSPKEDPTEAGGYRRYGAGKLCALMMLHELQGRLNKDPKLNRTSVLGVDPGAMATGITRRGSRISSVVVSRILIPALAPVMTLLNPNGMFRTKRKSAADVLRAALDTEALGEYPKEVYLNGTDPIETSRESLDPVKRQMLWRDSVRYASLKEEDTILSDWQ